MLDRPVDRRVAELVQARNIVPATIRQSEATTHVQTALGELELGKRAFADGSSVDLIIRPEVIRVVRENRPIDRLRGQILLGGSVRQITDHGTRVVIDTAVAGTGLEVSLSPSAAARLDIEIGGPIRLAPTIADGRVYFGSDDGRVYCLDAKSGELVWQVQAAPEEDWLLARGEMISKWPVRTGVLVHRGVAYLGAGIFPHEDVYLEGIDLETGRQVWGVDQVSSLDAGRNDLSPQGELLAKDDLLFVPSGGSLFGVVSTSRYVCTVFPSASVALTR